MEVKVGMPSGCQVNNTQDNQQGSGDDGSHHTAYFSYFTYPSHSFQWDEGSQPINDKHNGQCIVFVAGQCHVVCIIHSDESDRYSTECQYSRIPDRTFNPLYPDGKESQFLSVRFAYPTEHTTLFVLEHGSQFRRNEWCRNKEYDSCEKIIEGRTHSIYGLGRKSA